MKAADQAITARVDAAQRADGVTRLEWQVLNTILRWKILHERVRYEERGPAVSAEAKKVRARKMIRELRSLGYYVAPLPAPSSGPA